MYASGGDILAGNYFPVCSVYPGSGHYWNAESPPWWERAKFKKYDSKRMVKKKIKKVRNEESYVWFTVEDEGVPYE